MEVPIKYWVEKHKMNFCIITGKDGEHQEANILISIHRKVTYHTDITHKQMVKQLSKEFFNWGNIMSGI